MADADAGDKAQVHDVPFNIMYSRDWVFGAPAESETAKRSLIGNGIHVSIFLPVLFMMLQLRPAPLDTPASWSRRS